MVGEISPEAARGGPLALVHDAEMIYIDVPARIADLDVSAEELDRCRAVLQASALTDERSCLSI